MACQCEVCKDISRWNKGIESDNLEDRRAVLAEMFERIELAETDAQYFKNILKGKWDNAEEILENALALIKKQKANMENRDSISIKNKEH